MPSGYASRSSGNQSGTVASAARGLDGTASCFRLGHLKIRHRGLERKAGHTPGPDAAAVTLPFLRNGRGLNGARPHLRMTVQTLLGRGSSQHELERMIWLKRADPAD